MPRQLRLEYPGAIYHVMSRGDRREAIVKEDADRERFLATLGEACEKTGWEVHAWCLMKNHFHVVVETPQGNLVAGMKWFLGTYTVRFNRRHKVSGHLFSGRYKSLIVDGSKKGYLRTVCEYVHLNPVRAKLLRREQRRGEDHGEQWRKLRRGWYYGDEEFRKELLEQAHQKVGPGHYARERQEAAEEKAKQIVEEELRDLGWSMEELERRRKGDAEKIRIARRLRRETTVSLKWIAACLAMGTWTYLTNRLYHC